MIGVRTFLDIGRGMLLGLLLLVVSAHAVSPLGPPFERTAGSAFSAATADVALKAAPVLVIAKRIAPVTPPPLIAAIALARAPLLPAMTARPAGRLGTPTGPPAAESSFSPLVARAPPAA